MAKRIRGRVIVLALFAVTVLGTMAYTIYLWVTGGLK
jgi:hypothetical protein